MIYSIKDGKYSGDNTLSTAWGAAYIADAKSLKALKAIEIAFKMADFLEEAE